MKAFISLILCFGLPIWAWAESSTPVNQSAEKSDHDTKAQVSVSAPVIEVKPKGPEGQPSISILLNRELLRDAILQLFDSARLNCILDPRLDGPPYSNVRVSMKLQNAPFVDALASIARQHNLDVKVENGIYHIEAKGGLFWTQSDGLMPGPGTAVQAPAGLPELPKLPGLPELPGINASQPDLVTMSIPSMPVEDALEMLYKDHADGLPWSFKDKLGDTIMPGARFYRFPRNLAAEVVLAAAGLVPPTEKQKVVSSKGRVHLSDRIQYIPQGASYYGGYGANLTILEPAVAVAAYKSDKEWLITLLSSQGRCTDVLEKLLATSGANYMMGDLWWPHTGTMFFSAPNIAGGLTTQMLPAKNISVQLYDMTLGEILDNLLPTISLKYKKQGPPDNPTYIIEMSIPRDAPQVLPQIPPLAGKEELEKNK